MARYGGDYGWGAYDAGYRGYDRGYRRAWRDPRAGHQGGPRSAGRAPRYGGDYWWLGEREMIRNGQTQEYDEAYRRFNAESHPRYSPVGGMYHAMGGRYMYDRPPRPLREDTWFSDWTRWF